MRLFTQINLFNRDFPFFRSLIVTLLLVTHLPPTFRYESVLGFKEAWAGGEEAIELPPLASDEEKLATLLELKKIIPELFTQASLYSLNLANLLDYEAELLMLLKNKHPEYSTAFRHKKFYELAITPPPEGISVSEVKIKSESIQEWKKTLRNVLEKLNSEEPESPLTDVLAKQIQLNSDHLRILGITAPAKVLENLGKPIKKKATPEERKNQFLLKNAVQDKKDIKSKIEAVLRIYDQFEGLSFIRTELEQTEDKDITSENLKETLKAKLEQARNAVVAEENLKRFSELWIVLHRPTQISPTTVEEAKASIEALTAQDLTFFQDKNDALKPSIEKIPHLDPSFFKRITDGIFKESINQRANQTEEVVNLATQAIRLIQVPPLVGIFRGCTGSDCSSRYSFPYPNDPQDQTYFIQDSKGRLKGYVSATQVLANGEPALYVITVSGNRVNARDTDLILRGLDQVKEKMGIKYLLLPELNHLPGLINFPAPKGVYENYIKHQPTVGIIYQGQAIRKEIEDYIPSSAFEDDHNNTGTYDRMESNQRGVIFRSNELSKKIKTELKEIPITAMKVPPLNEVSNDELLKLILDFYLLDRDGFVVQLVQHPLIQKRFHPKTLKALLALLKTCSDTPGTGKLDIQSFKREVNFKLNDLIGNTRPIAESHEFLYPGITKCSDAFSTANSEAIAQFIVNDMSKNAGGNYQPLKKSLNFVLKHRNDLYPSSSFQKFFSKLKRNLEDANPNVREKAIKAILSFRYKDAELDQKSIALFKDSNSNIRVHAIYSQMGSSKPEVYAGILSLFKDPETDVRRAAASAIGTLKMSQPVDFQEIAALLKDPDDGVRTQAIESLKKLRVTDSEIHRKISKLITDPNSSVSNAAYWALAELNVSDPVIHQEILALLQSSNNRFRETAIRLIGDLSHCMPINLVVHQLLISSLNDPDSTIRAVTICTLRKLKSADPEGHYQMALILKNKDSWNMRYAHDALMELKPTDSKVVRELELLLQDSDSFTRRRALDILMVSQVLKAKHRSMLIALSEDPDKKVRETASKALEALSNI